MTIEANIVVDSIQRWLYIDQKLSLQGCLFSKQLSTETCANTGLLENQVIEETSMELGAANKEKVNQWLPKIRTK